VSTPERRQLAEAAGLAAVIERLGAAIALAEEPSGFAAALDAGAPDAFDD